MIKKTLVCLSVAAAVWSVSAKTCYVDCNRPDDSGNGESEATAFRTIQAAVNKCYNDRAFNEVVALPGVYREGLSTTDGNGRSRVYINGNDGLVITLRSRDGAATTSIEGAYDPTSDWYGMGPNAIRCITVRGGGNSKIIGFTLCNGATAGTAAARPDGVTMRGGAVLGTGGTGCFTLVDCVLCNNAGTRGGATYGGTAVRCRFLDNVGSNYGAAARETALYYCLIARNRVVGQTPGSSGFNNVGTVAYPKATVNCTFYDNDGRSLAMMDGGTGSGPICNSILIGSAGWGDVDSAKHLNLLHHCASESNDPVTGGDSCVKCPSDEVFSPVSGDYRITTNSVSVNAGSASWLSNIPSAYRYETIDGVTLPSTGTVDLGCFGVRARPATAKMKFAVDSTQGITKVNDEVISNGNLHFASETWPLTVKYEYVSTNDARAVARYWLKRDGDLWQTCVPFNPDRSSMTMMMPPADGRVYQLEYVRGGKLFVDADAAEAGADGSSARPYPTIQQAVDAALAGHSDICIFVAPGHYNRGETSLRGASNRVSVASHSGYGISIRSTGGKAVTFIEGKSDPTTVDNPTYGGCGTNACRCVAADGGTVILQGFTLTGGRGFITASNSDTDALHGGGVAAADSSLVVMDCDITDCVASRGAGAFCGKFVRCVFSRNRSFSNSTTRAADLHGCLFEYNQGPCIVGQGSVAYQTTAAGNTNADQSGNFHYLMGDSYGLVGGSNVGADSGNYSDLKQRYSVFQGVSSGNLQRLQPTTVGGVDPLFADAANGDWRVYACGPAGHRLPVSAFHWFSFTCIDIDGNPFRFNADGTTVAGAFADALPGVFASSERTNGVSPAGVTPVTEAGTVTFTATADRPVRAWEVGGEEFETTSRTYDLSVSPVAANGDVYGVHVKPVYGNVWYVDANDGSDGNDGYTLATARKTLAAILAKAREDGDVVKALPGDYNEGRTNGVAVSINGVSVKVYARASVKGHVTLESTEGAERTFITGERDSTENGLGPNALRCVSVAANGTVRGFTLRNGHSDDGSERPESCGGGVLAENRDALVENCVLTNCCATRGGGGRHGTYVKCVFVGNNCSANAPAARDAYMYGCFVDRNCFLNNNNFGTCYACRMENCTVGPNNKSANGNALYAAFSNNRTTCDQRVVNTLICSPAGAWGGAYSNCVFRTGAGVGGQTSGELYDVHNAIHGDVSIDDNGVPLKGNAAIGVAAPSLDTRAVDDTDLYGRQRVWNVTRDVGCCDYDWRGDFASVLKPSGVTVLLAEPNVTRTDDAVKIVSGRLDATWSRSSSAKARCFFSCEVKGTGTLTVNLNGEPFVELTASDGKRELDFQNELLANALSFAYVPGAEDVLGAEISNFHSPNGTTICFR